MNRTHHVILALVAAVAGVSGCDRSDDPGTPAPAVGEAQKNAYALSWSRWYEGDIVVCWEKPEAVFEQERGWVRDAIARTWSAHAPVRFVGWGPCDDVQWGVRITVADERAHVAALGWRLAREPRGMVLNFTFENWATSCQQNRRNCIEKTAVHEFGHALGFAHEHNRPDRPASCDDAPQGSDGDLVIGAWDLHSVMNYCNPVWDNDGELSAGDIAGVQALYGLDQWSRDFGSAWWRPDRHLRLTGDVNGDGADDVVGFGDDGVYVGLSDESGFAAAQRWSEGFVGLEWRLDTHPRMLADVDGDGRQDLVGFGKYGVAVAVSTGDGFAPPAIWTEAFGGNSDWTGDLHLRTVADVNGDGRADALGFGDDATYVALSLGRKFADPVVAADGFDRNRGWRVERHPRLVGDVDGDGRSDVVGFGEAGVELALGTADGRFTPPVKVIAGLGHAHGWRAERDERVLTDVDGDGRDDIVAFGPEGTVVALSRGAGFAPPSRVLDAFGSAGEWDPSWNLRLVGDMDGDGRADIAQVADAEVRIAHGRADGTFADPVVWFVGMSRIDGWSEWAHPRALADVDGDGALDVVGFGPQGVHVFVY